MLFIERLCYYSVSFPFDSTKVQKFNEICKLFIIKFYVLIRKSYLAYTEDKYIIKFVIR